MYPCHVFSAAGAPEYLGLTICKIGNIVFISVITLKISVLLYSFFFKVMSRLCKEENQDAVRLLLNFLPKVVEFCEKYKLDISSSQRVANFIATQCQKKFNSDMFTIFLKYFQTALISLVQREVSDRAILEKVFGSCYHVSSNTYK